MAKINWELIKKQYLSEYAETGVTVRAFCVRNGLVYSTARKYLNNKLLESKESKPTEHKENEQESAAETIVAKGITPPKRRVVKPKSSKQSNRGGKRAGAGAPKQNKNAFVHGLMTKAFGNLVKYSHQVDDEFKLEVHKLAALQALEAHTLHKQELAAFLEELENQESTNLTELEQEQIERIERRIESSFQKVCYHTSKLEQLEGYMANRRYTNNSTRKVVAQTTQVEVDTNLKRKSIGLAEANTDKSKAQAALARHELDLRQREGLGDDDDLGMLLDEVQDLDDDEILQRFKEQGGQLHED
ncbi:hypothetical protein [Vibrio parahaemolyticus]|uniref:hypothetical protein n=1 Tax=Vibrio parahaemolyticus TaxID=670 RepID=UPI001110E0B1|nr:hypothetical protein [Vibrio parahaemolyticus]MDG2761610.1 hypothetical protein [Vibrio parahaemolyticus]TMX40861.1 hypothetical protein DA098_03250 [Vibrio parahaemolyticus]TMX79834.1 hypothetical protein DA094_04950 [Vibrio parahaemolyticus]